MLRGFGLRHALIIGFFGAACGSGDGTEDVGQRDDALKRPCPRPGKDGPCDVDRGADAALADAACATGRLVGTAVRYDALTNDPTYAALLASQFTYVTPENEMKWGSLQPTDPRSWDFTQADAIVDSARAAGQAVKGHALIWHNQLPAFVDDSLSRRELERLIHRHIETTVRHFRRDVSAWDVVNEAIADDGTLRDSVFSRKLGDAFIADAFREAHAADSKARLFYNDYGIETVNAKSDAVYELVRKLRRKHVPIDGVGFQMHVDARFAPSESDLITNFDRFAALGLEINISEMDVRVAGLAGASQIEKLAIQQQIYHRVVSACVKTPRCRALTTWGFTDRYSWIDSTFGPDDPLEYDEAYARKPAYYGMVDGFRGLPPDPPGEAPNLAANGSFESGLDGFSGFGVAGPALTRLAHTGVKAGRTSGRTDTGQGPAYDVTRVVQPGFVYDVAVFGRLAGAASDALRTTLMVSCAGQAAQFLPIASGTGSSRAWTELAGRVSVPFCTIDSAIVYVEGPAAGVDILIDDLTLRPRGEPLGSNLVANPDFEAGTAGWNGMGAALAVSTAQAHGGAQSAVVTGRTQTWQGPLYDLLSAAVAGATYRMSAFARVEGTSHEPVSLTVKSVCSNGATTFTPVSSRTASDTAWTELSGSYVVPTCSLTELGVYVEGPAPGVALYVDDVAVQQRLSVPVVLPPQGFNLLGNGDLELGTQGWQAFGGTLVRTNTQVHGGSFAAQSTGRTATWNGPSVFLPTGSGSYAVRAFALQSSPDSLGLLLSASVSCNGAQSFLTVASATAAGGAWVEMAGTLNVPSGCTVVQLYLQQNGGAVFPDLFLDDVSVQAIEVPNLVGDGGLEVGTNGWQAFGATFARSTDFARSGLYSGASLGRTASWNGPSYFLPTGAGRYQVGIHAFQTSPEPLGLLLSASLNCGGAQTFPTLAAATAAPSTWTALSGTLDVPAGCVAVQLYVQQNGGTAFPNLYVDDLQATAIPE